MYMQGVPKYTSFGFFELILQKAHIMVIKLKKKKLTSGKYSLYIEYYKGKMPTANKFIQESLSTLNNISISILKTHLKRERMKKHF